MPQTFVLSYEDGHIVIRSDATEQHSEKLTATVCLSYETPNDVEQIYSVGVSIDAVREGTMTDITGQGRGYRYIDPFARGAFDADIASKAVAYLLLVQLRRSMSKWRFSLRSRAKGVRLNVRIPEYGGLPASQRLQFESGINRLLPGVILIVEG